MILTKLGLSTQASAAYLRRRKLVNELSELSGDDLEGLRFVRVVTGPDGEVTNALHNELNLGPVTFCGPDET